MPKQSLTTSTCEPSPPQLPKQEPCRKLLLTITAAFAKTKTLPQASVSNHRGICQDKNLTTSTREPSPRHWPRQKPQDKHPRTITTAFAKTKHKHLRATAIAKTKALPQASANHHHGFCHDENLTTNTCEPSAAFAKTKTLPQAPANNHRGICQDKNLTLKHLRTITAAFAKTETLTQASANHHRANCQDKNLTTSTREPSLWHLSRQKPYHKHLRTITTAFAKRRTLPQAPANHHRGICQDKNLTTSTCEPSPRQLPTHKITTSIREPSPRHLPRRNPYHQHPQTITVAFARTIPHQKHLRAITEATAKTTTLPQAPASHHRDICQDKNLTTSICEPSPRNCQDENLTKHLRAITGAFAKAKLLPQAPASRHRGICQDKKPYHKHPQTITAAFGKTKNLTTSIREPSTRHLPRQKSYHKHPRTIAVAFAKTKTLPQAPANHHHGNCKDKNLTTSIREPAPRHLARRKPYHKHLRTITAACSNTRTREPSPWRLPREEPYHKHLRAATAAFAAFAKTETLPQPPESHHRGICQDKKLPRTITEEF